MNVVPMETYSQRILKGGGVVAWQRLARFRKASRAVRQYSKSGLLDDLLDIGAADGIGLPFLKPLAKRLLSVNYYEEHSREFKAAHPDDEILTADARKLPLVDASFDAVVSFETLHLLGVAEERQKGLAEIYRVLRPGGLLVCSIPIEVGYSALIKLTARAATGHQLDGMSLAMALRHCFYRFGNIEQFDKGRQVGFNAYHFVDDVASLFTVLETWSIPIPILFPMNLLVVARKEDR